MDNGSGGFMTDLVFNGGHAGMFLGNQQFTTRNLTFNNVQTAVFMNVSPFPIPSSLLSCSPNLSFHKDILLSQHTPS